MTLGIFTDDFYPHIGGIGRYVYEVTRRLPEEKLLIFSPCDNEVPNHIRVNPPLHKRFRNLSFSAWLHRNVQDMIKRYRLSRINIQCGPGGLFLLRKIEVPVIATCYHTWWQQAHHIRSQFWKKIFLPFERHTYGLADRIVCISKDSRNMLVEKYGIQPDKIAVVHPGVDIHRFFPIGNTEKTPNSVLFVGRVDKRKGADFLIRSMPHVVDRIPEVKLYIGGEGKGLSKLKQFVDTHHLSRNVQFLGFIPDDALNMWYNRVQCVVVPSVFEGFGLTAVESMAAGTSVICTRVASLQHIIENGVCGYHVEYNDTTALGEKIVSLLKDRNMQNEFGKKGREMVELHYNWDTLAQKLINELLSASRQPLHKPESLT
jgi:glycosyltransferase involved in cell wall biosynthesis